VLLHQCPVPICTLKRKSQIIVHAVARKLFGAGADDEQVEILKGRQDSGYELNNLLDKDTITDAAFYGHLDVVKDLRTLGFECVEDTREFAAQGGQMMRRCLYSLNAQIKFPKCQ